MSQSVDAVVQAARSGRRLIAVADEDARGYLAALRSADPAGLGRVVLAWDEDGFRSLGDYPDELPEGADLAAALDFIRDFAGQAMFVVDLAAEEPAADDAPLRRRLKQLGDRAEINEGVLIVLVTPQPWPSRLTKLVHWIGPEATETTAAEPKRGKSKDAQIPFAEIRDLRRFNTPEWQERIERMSAEDMEALIASGVHRDALGRIAEVRQTLKQRFAQKDDVIDAVCAAAIAQVPCVLMGPPGTAKGHIIRSFCEGLGLSSRARAAGGDNGGSRRYFEYQLTRFTTPEEIFGPIHVQDLIDRQVYRRVTDGYLPTAHIAFLDEIFKASSAILNTLLSILNERLFYNEGEAQPVPLATIFAASNEPPQDESLSALYDRFPIRVNCPRVEDEHLPDLLKRTWEDAFDRQFSTHRTAVAAVACPNDLRLLHRVSRVMYGGRSLKGDRDLTGRFHEEFLRAFRALRSEANISDRTLGALLSFARARALLDGKETLTVDELDVFKNVMWDTNGELERVVRNLKRVYQR